MKRSHERHALILAMVEAEDYVTIEAMAQACETSSQTIRRDLALLSQSGKILRYHGGARRIGGDRAPSYEARSATHVAEKTAAASLITDIIPDDASLFLAGGSTLEYVAQALLKRNRLTIVTNNLHAAMVFNEREDFRVHLVGGWMRASSGSLIGTSTSEAIAGFSLNYAIVSARGITSDGWLLEYDQDLVGPVAAMLANAQSSVLVADSSKFGSAGIVRTAHLKEIDHFLTERPLNADLAALLSENRVTVHAPNGR
jgi:DeoR family transcriptional regulator, glycerol-3-phosphate regulon repressor